MLDRARLAAILGMIGSSHDGEVVSAARHAERLRREAGTTWYDIVSPPVPEEPSSANANESEIERDLALVAANVDSPWLTEWEREYLTEKQGAVIKRIAAKLQRMGAAA